MTRKELESALIKLKEENEQLKQDNAYLRFELEELRAKRYRSGKKKPHPDSQGQQPAPKKKGGLFGHIGWFRKKPERIDRVEEVKIRCCPECGSKDIRECHKVDEHIVGRYYPA